MTSIGARQIRFVECDTEGAEFKLLHEADLSMVDCLALEFHYFFLGPDRVQVRVTHLSKTEKVLGLRTAAAIKKNDWPPPSLIWHVNLQIPPRQFNIPNTLATLMRQ